MLTVLGTTASGEVALRHGKACWRLEMERRGCGEGWRAASYIKANRGCSLVDGLYQRDDSLDSLDSICRMIGAAQAALVRQI